jgi:hypothetical protein
VLTLICGSRKYLDSPCTHIKCLDTKNQVLSGSTVFGPITPLIADDAIGPPFVLVIDRKYGGSTTNRSVEATWSILRITIYAST